MAIAYFIPDQAKLLAGQRPSRAATNTNSRAPSNTQASSRLPQNNQANETAPVNNAANRGYGTTINITVPTLNNTTQEPLGCWDFLTQVFCHALRFYHESSQLQPTVIQISVNFNSQTATTTTADNSTATTTNSETLATAAPATTSTEDPKQRKFSKRKN
ncbi:cell death protein Grim [Calliphora vicina]|uniref:cell death protein Grim n=1 Tax=Calliphora vicina TaxID=7373 RepID=UPI00325A9B22